MTGAGATVTAGGRSTTTNAKDQFTLTQVPEGSQTLVATKSGCEITPVSMSLTVTGDVADRTFTAKCAAAPPAATYSISGNVGGRRDRVRCRPRGVFGRERELHDQQRPGGHAQTHRVQTGMQLEARVADGDGRSEECDRPGPEADVQVIRPAA